MKDSKVDIKTEVNFNDGYLVVSSLDAVDPILWRAKIADVNEVIIFIKSSKKFFDINIKMSDADDKKIATFDKKDRAVEIMSMINIALLSEKPEHGKKILSKCCSNSSADSKSYKSDIVMAVIGTFLVFLLIWLIQSPNKNGNDVVESSKAQIIQDKGSVPESMDDFLNSR